MRDTDLLVQLCRSRIKPLSALLLMASSTICFAEPLCRDFKPELKERHDEERFTEEGAIRAARYLESYSRAKDGLDPWGAFPQIEGWILKRAALEEAKVGGDDIAYTQFCMFITKPGVHRD